MNYGHHGWTKRAILSFTLAAVDTVLQLKMTSFVFRHSLLRGVPGTCRFISEYRAKRPLFTLFSVRRQLYCTVLCQRLCAQCCASVRVVRVTVCVTSNCWLASAIQIVPKNTTELNSMVTLLGTVLLLTMTSLYDQSVPILFQWDKLMCHTTQIISNQFVEHNNEFTVLKCTLQSPDLNPVEHL